MALSFPSLRPYRGGGIAHGPGADPSAIPDALLRRIRGGLFTVRAPVSQGPRPFAASNIAGTAGLQARPDPDERAIVIRAQRIRGYTHGAIGSFIDPGYHATEGQANPAVDFRADGGAFAAQCLQEMYDGGVIPIVFLSPDNYTLAQMRSECEPIFRTPLWQRLVRICVPKGWEPSQDTSNAEYVDFFRWAGDVFPNAARCLHMTANFDAPGNNTDLSPYLDQIPRTASRAHPIKTRDWAGRPVKLTAGKRRQLIAARAARVKRTTGTKDGDPGRAANPHYLGNAGVWQRLAPHFDIYLQQVGEFYVRPSDAGPTQGEFEQLYRTPNRFESGYAGWPQTSAAGGPVIQVYAEGCSYASYWKNLPEDYAQEWGDLALKVGAPGVLDGFHAQEADWVAQQALFAALGVRFAQGT